LKLIPGPLTKPAARRPLAFIASAALVLALLVYLPGPSLASRIRKSAQPKPPASSTVNIYPAGLAFFDQMVGTQSSGEAVTLVNNGTTTLTIAKIATSAGFSETNTCKGSVLAGASCTISVHFKPTAASIQAGTLTVTSSDAGSPHVINVQGTGVNNAISFLPAALNFESQPLNVAAGTASVTVTNISGTAVTISTVIASGDFSQTSNCVSPLPPNPGSACRIDVTFKPTAAGTRTGAITITDSAPGSPHVLNLTGVGGVSGVSFSPANLNFGNVNLGQSSALKNVTVTNNNTSAINFISIVGDGDYTTSNNCGTSLNAGASCNLAVTFSPSGSGKRSGRVTFSDTDPSNLQTFLISGTGVIPASTVTISPRAASMTSQQTQSYVGSISGVVSSAVTWAVDGVIGGNATVGTISASGLYTPPATAGRHAIKAASTADPTQKAVSFAYVTNYAGTLTYHNDAMRTGQNLAETVLTPGNVNSTQFGKLFSVAVDGKVYAQPLYVPNVTIPGQGTHNVLYVATEHDSLYAFDADNLQSAPLWQTSFIDPANGITTIVVGSTGTVDIFCNSMKPEVGITGTPVIDPSTNTMYLVVRTKEVQGSTTNFVQRLHAIDITTGEDKPNSPAVIQASFPGIGVGNDGNGNVVFNPLTQNQRSGLLLLNGTIYIAYASFCDPPDYHGWILGYDENSLDLTQVANTTPNGWAGGIWGSGDAPAADASGNIYVTTGNGTFDGNFGGSDYSDSILSYSTSGGTLSLIDSFTPYNQYFLVGPDLDLGSGGVTLVPDQPSGPTHLLFGGGKTGNVYLLNRDGLGGYDSSNDNAVQQSLVHAAGGKGKGDQGIWPKGAFWQNQVYYVGTGDVPKAYRLYDGQLSTAPISKGNVVFGYPAALPAISSNGTNNGIVWLVLEATPQKVPVVLYAFEADNLSVQLYNSTGVTTGLGVQFGIPTVANGKVYVGTASEIDVYGLLP
jgi:hypothetical protein